jgi:hypothetical protein
LEPPRAEWEKVADRMIVVKLTPLAGILVPSVGLSSLSRKTRGLSFFPGGSGLAMGASLTAGVVALGWLLSGYFGIWGAVLLFWLVGTTGVVMMAGSMRPIAFVKAICTRCRLLPVIKEHEAIHLAGVAAEKQVWASMKQRHSVESLRLEGDPAICWFCPIPERLSEK